MARYLPSGLQARNLKPCGKRRRGDIGRPSASQRLMNSLPPPVATTWPDGEKAAQSESVFLGCTSVCDCFQVSTSQMQVGPRSVVTARRLLSGLNVAVHTRCSCDNCRLCGCGRAQI